MLIVRRLCVSALLFWLLLEAVKTFPSYLAYFNEFVGGPGNGYNYLAGPDIDWGQDLKRLAEYLRRQGITTVKLSYFGADDPRLYGIRYERLRQGYPTTGYVAVSVSSLNECGRDFGWLRNYKPIAKVGYSIFVYRIPASEPLPAPVPSARCIRDSLLRFI